MVSPFSSKTPVKIVDLLPIHKGQTNVANTNQGNIAVGTVAMGAGTILDFSKFKGTFYYSIVWGHEALTTGTSTQVILRDFTNNTNLFTFTSTGSAATLTDISTALSAFSTITAPGGVAKIGFVVQNNDGATRTFTWFDASLWVI